MSLHLETAEVEPGAAADAAVVLMHGLGADGHDFESVVPELRPGTGPVLRWVFPHAPVRPVSISGGYRMRAWFDILGLSSGSPEDEAGIRESAAAIDRLVEREARRGIPADRVVLAGFSQGGALALHTALRHPQRLAGVIALSTYLPLTTRLPVEAHPANAAVPIFMAHGTWDDVVPLALGEASRDVLLRQGYDVEWHTYPVPHSISAEEIADVREWLRRALPPRG
ncbi:MAG TPA: alpha/beta fold hydrolase [Vicinamibacteria bacterium]|nr:alpha/beta fold hydrolase [Vicinamibacteria bacterium]